ncbi:MAG: RNA 2'-phosphotransferase [Planctomycetaceae bacterium]
MFEKHKKVISKYLSLVLRHQPELIGLELDKAGWVETDKLLKAMNRAGRRCNREQLEEVVRDNDKQRFQFNENKTRIRATQGHSLTIELEYEAVPPPDVLLHGTPTKFVDSIRRQGLKKQSRHHVHLHCDAELASSVGKRRGQPVVLTIDAKGMAAAGHEFFVTPNQVWLTDNVPPQFITFPKPE